jgi:hypothetical protein
MTLLDSGSLAETDCPRCATYACAGHLPPACGHAVEAIARCIDGDHRFCPAAPEDIACDWAVTVRPAVLEAGLPHGTPAQPIALVLVSPATGRAIYAGRTFSDHREAKPARTRAGGGGWGAKARAYLVCSRCQSLH